MERKVQICHLCGVEMKRFAEHISTAHKIRDYKKEKVSYYSHASYLLVVIVQLSSFLAAEIAYKLNKLNITSYLPTLTKVIAHCLLRFLADRCCLH